MGLKQEGAEKRFGLTYFLRFSIVKVVCGFSRISGGFCNVF